MAIRLKRKQFGGVGQAVSNTLGGVATGVSTAVGKTLEGTGSMANSGLGAVTGGAAGVMGLTGAVGSALGAINPLLALAAPIVAGGIGAAATKGVGKGLQAAGQTMQGY